MGEVWAGAHVVRGVPVAVKFLRPRRRNSERTARAFRDEVRAMARLDHPAIVYVYDFGLAPTGTAPRSGGRIPDGSPYLVMELLDGEPLDRFRGRMAWPPLRAVLLGLRDALGHAHARGVLHL
ncbi:MAG: hypothetical protein KC620_25855, partial [Myxococcales bacterium]|nr:hypothetical protein [Myxococcales bacterium]